MKIMWASNAPWTGSGYGQTTARFTPLIRDLGHDVALFANYGLAGKTMLWDNMLVYPAMMDSWGNDVIASYTLHHFRNDRNAGWVMLLQDVWTMKSEKLKDFHVAAWAPVDHEPAPPRVIEFFTRNGAVPIAQSRHGFRMFEQAGLNPLLVPHGIDTDLFRPVGKAEGRAKLGLPEDAFVFGMVAGNTGTHPSRKAFPEVFQAFKTIHDRHPDTVLYVHSMRLKLHAGLDLTRLAENIGISDSVVFADPFAISVGEIGTADMPQIYSAMDVLVNPAYGEGFGMPIIEAQACGVPVLLADNTAMPELLGGGWLCPSYPSWDEDQLSWWGRVHVPELTEVMEEAYGASDRRKTEARDFVVEHFDLEHIMSDYWKPALDVLSGMLEAPKATPIR